MKPTQTRHRERRRRWSPVRAVRGVFAKIHPHPVFVLGNQKAGTTAIAAMLGQASGRSVSLDLRREIPVPSIPDVLRGTLAFEDFLNWHRVDFAREIVKEPGLTLLFDQLAKRFPQSQFVFIVRDPRDNIRSILNRLDLAGDLLSLSSTQRDSLTLTWESIVFGTGGYPSSENPVESLAHRWDHMARVFLDNRSRMTLVRYEDFIADKPGVLQRTLNAINFEARHDASELFDRQFQPRGNRAVAWDEFFGGANLARIEQICGESMRQLDYSF